MIYIVAELYHHQHTLTYVIAIKSNETMKLYYWYISRLCQHMSTCIIYPYRISGEGSLQHGELRRVSQHLNGLRSGPQPIPAPLRPRFGISVVVHGHRGMPCFFFFGKSVQKIPRSSWSWSTHGFFGHSP